MSIAIDAKQCVGCGKCRMVCPGSLIHMNQDGKAFIKYPKDCWGCTSCLKECAVHAIRFYLGADMGGMGSLVHTEKEGDILRWIVDHPNGKTSEIRINFDSGACVKVNRSPWPSSSSPPNNTLCCVSISVTRYRFCGSSPFNRHTPES